MLGQPGFDTVGMEPVIAGQVGDLTADQGFVHTNGTVGLAGGFVQIFLCNGLLRQGSDSFGRGRAGGV